METYLKKFYKALNRYEGSLVKVSTAKKLTKNAKEYLAKLAKESIIEKVDWGWYYINPRKGVDVLGFLQQDRNFKVIVRQSAASFWNQDFVHRGTLNIAVDNLSFKKVLEAFAKKKGWVVSVIYVKNAKRLKFIRIKKLAIESPDAAVVECTKNWAFADAIDVLVVNKDRIKWQKLIKNSYWARVSGTNIRVRQAIEYAAYQLNKSRRFEFDTRKTSINNSFVRQELDEAVEKVLEFE